MFDRAKAGLANFVRGVFPRFDYFARYPGTVVKQGGNNSFDFQPDSTRVPGLSGLPVRFGLPGVSVQLALNSRPRCLLGFFGGDPTQPFLDLWEQPGLNALTVDPSADVNLGPAAAAVGRVGDAVAPTSDMTTWMSQVAGAVNTLVPGSVAPPAPITFANISAGSPKVKA